MMGVDSFLWLLKLWDELCKEFRRKPSPIGRNKASTKPVEKIVGITVKEIGTKGTAGEHGLCASCTSSCGQSCVPDGWREA